MRGRQRHGKRGAAISVKPSAGALPKSSSTPPAGGAGNCPGLGAALSDRGGLCPPRRSDRRRCHHVVAADAARGNRRRHHKRTIASCRRRTALPLVLQNAAGPGATTMSAALLAELVGELPHARFVKEESGYPGPDRRRYPPPRRRPLYGVMGGPRRQDADGRSSPRRFRHQARLRDRRRARGAVDRHRSRRRQAGPPHLPAAAAAARPRGDLRHGR